MIGNRHNREVKTTRGIDGPANREDDNLGKLASSSIVVRAEGAVSIAGDSAMAREVDDGIIEVIGGVHICEVIGAHNWCICGGCRAVRERRIRGSKRVLRGRCWRVCGAWLPGRRVGWDSGWGRGSLANRRARVCIGRAWGRGA